MNTATIFCWSVKFVLLGGLLILVIMGCEQVKEPNTQMSRTINSSESESPNSEILDEANAAAKWFHAKKTRPIWARQLTERQLVQTLEGEERVEAGHYLCKGEAGDIWPQTEATLLKRYTQTDIGDDDDWRKYEPHPDAKGVMAIQINHPFEVTASWGKLSGKAGDFLLKNFEDRETDYPVDVWIVDRVLFAATYKTVASSE